MWLLEHQIPNSTIFVLLLSLLISFLTSLVTGLLTNKQQMASWRKQISEWQKEFNEARKSGDKKLLEKAMRKQKQVLQIQSKMFKQQMKVTLVFMVPFFLFFAWLNTLYLDSTTGLQQTVAYFPGFSGLIAPHWYLICSLTFGTLFSHILGVGMGAPEE